MYLCVPSTRTDFAFGALAASAACLALGLAACKHDDAGPKAVDPQLLAFEKAYSEGLAYASKDGVKLIGFKTITIPREAIDKFDAIYQENRAKLKHYYLDKPNRLLRIYFPVESALVEIGDGIVEANTLGELDIAPGDSALRNIAVIGRQQTPSIRGVRGNIIKNGIIYLAQKNLPDHASGGLYVFDFGVKLLLEHDHGDGAHATKTGGATVDTFDGGSPPPPYDMSSPPPPYDMSSPPPPDMSGPPPPSDLGETPDLGEECTLDAAEILALRGGNMDVARKISALEEEGKCKGKANCMTNHGGPNCSNAFGINKGRCPFDATVCMDYNGIATNCVNAGSGFWKYWNFPDSDCDVALAWGHCWNELM